MRINKIALSLLLGGLIVNSSVLANHKSSTSDEQIGKAVDRTIDRYPELDDDVNFKVEDGCVTLTGKVDNSAEKQQAARLISNIAGVREIENRLEIESR